VTTAPVPESSSPPRRRSRCRGRSTWRRPASGRAGYSHPTANHQARRRQAPLLKLIFYTVTVPRARRVGTLAQQTGEQVGPECPTRAAGRPAAYVAWRARIVRGW